MRNACHHAGPLLRHVLHIGSRGDPVYAVKRAMQKTGFFDRIGPHRFYGPRFAVRWHCSRRRTTSRQTENRAANPPDARPVLRQLRLPALHRTLPRRAGVAAPRDVRADASDGRARRVPRDRLFRRRRNRRARTRERHARVAALHPLGPDRPRRRLDLLPPRRQLHLLRHALQRPRETRVLPEGRQDRHRRRRPHQWWPSHIHEGKHKGQLLCRISELFLQPTEPVVLVVVVPV
jgi:hypothetical protein